jgi:glycosyltransferase involved in cell wall biosynthesis
MNAGMISDFLDFPRSTLPGFVCCPATSSASCRVLANVRRWSRKGADVLIKAAQLLSEEKDLPVRIEMYGDHSSQPEAFRKDFEALLAEAPANFIFRGPYENWRVRSLMRGVDAVVVPSIWWENSPLVIQEALASRRPIICSDIGGMAEKVRDGIDGFHFRAGDPRSLAELFATLGRAPERLQTMQSTMRRPLSIDETMARIIGVYQTAFSHTSREDL